MKSTKTTTSIPNWPVIKTLQLMKTRPAILKFLILMFSVFATTAVFGQATIVWNGGAGTGAIGNATNWVGGVSPNSAAGDLCQWDSTVPGNLFLTAAAANGGFNAVGPLTKRTRAPRRNAASARAYPMRPLDRLLR